MPKGRVRKRAVRIATFATVIYSIIITSWSWAYAGRLLRWAEASRGVVYVWTLGLVAGTAIPLYLLLREAIRAILGRRAVEGALADVYEQLKVLVETTPLAVYALDAEGRVSLWNKAAETTFGWKEEEVLGKVLPTVPPEERGFLVTMIKRMLAGETLSQVMVRRLRRDDFLIDVRISGSALRLGNRQGLAALIFAADVTQERLMNEARDVLRRIDLMITEQRPTQAIAEAACEAVAEIAHCELIWLGLRQPDGELKLYAYGGQPALLDLVTKGCRAPQPCSCLSCRVIETGEPYYVDLTKGSDLPEAEALIEKGIRSVLILPMSAGDRVIGAAFYYSRTFDLGAPGTIFTLRRSVDQVGISLQMADQVEQIRLQTTALTSLANPVMITDQNGVIQWVNPAFTNHTGYRTEEAVGQTPRLLNSGLTPPNVFMDLWRTILSGLPWRGELQNRRKDGTIYAEEQTITPVLGADGKISHFVAVKQDVTDRKQQEEQLRFLASHDSLTGLLNRNALTARMADLAAHGHTGILVAIDLDQFDLFNNRVGQEKADQILRQVAALIEATVDQEGLMARAGSDEFIIVLADAEPSAGQELVRRLAKRIAQERFTEDGQVDGVTFCSTIIVVDLTMGAQEVLPLAQLMLRKAQERGPGYHGAPVTQEEALTNLDTVQWGTQLSDAIRENALILQFQPVVDIRTEEITYAEALLRFRRPGGDLASAGSFIEAAEQFRFMREIDRWVLAQTLKQLERNPQLRLFMNLSGQSLQDDKQLRWVSSRIRAAGPVARRLTIEITESVAVGQLDRLREWMQSLAHYGCQFALDDLGQGFSSLSYLTNLPVAFVKIDGSFVVDIAHNEKNRLVVEALTQMCHTMGKQVVAEWVEDEGAKEILRSFGVEYGQGFYLGRPDSLPTLLAKVASAPAQSEGRREA